MDSIKNSHLCRKKSQAPPHIAPSYSPTKNRFKNRGLTRAKKYYTSRSNPAKGYKKQQHWATKKLFTGLREQQIVKVSLTIIYTHQR